MKRLILAALLLLALEAARAQTVPNNVITYGPGPAVTVPVPIAQGGTGITTLPIFQGARITSTQSLTSGTTAKVQLNSITKDTISGWNGGNFWYKPNVAGTYEACGGVYVTGTGLTYLEAAISKNGTTGSGGTEISDTVNQSFSSNAWSVALPCASVSMNGTTDTLELDVTAIGTTPIVQIVRNMTQLYIKRVGP